jgi:hypothetical protein
MAKVIVYRRHAHTQSVPSNTWTIIHNLNIVSPVVDVWILLPDNTYTNSDAHEVTFVDSNTVIVVFNGTLPPPAGTACVT